MKRYICQKTDQIGTPDKCAYNFLYNYAIVTYSIYIYSYDEGLSNKPKYIDILLVVLEI